GTAQECRDEASKTRFWSMSTPAIRRVVGSGRRFPRRSRALRSVYRDGRDPGIPSARPALRGRHDLARQRWADVAGKIGDFVNFLFSLMEVHDLATLLKAAQLAGIDTFVTLHKTVDTVIDGRIVSLGEIAETLLACTRLIVHTEADVARLRSFAVVDNVAVI